MRVALLTYSTRPRGGVVHTLALAEALADEGVSVDIWSLARGGDQGFFRAVDDRVGLRLVPFPDLEREEVGARILRSITTLRAGFVDEYDVVHAQDCISANAVPRCIRTVHHLDTFTTPELAACHERAIVMPYAHICVSASVAAQVHDGWGLNATVIPNGVDAARFAAAAEDGATRSVWRERLGRYVLAVGGIEPRKGSHDLVRAMAEVRHHDPDLGLVIAGGETLFDYRDYRAEFDRLCTSMQVAPVILGTVDHDALPALVAQADVLAFPSTKEGFGLAAMEALAAGVPVVARDLPVLREVFGDAVDYAADAHELATGLLAASRSRDPLRADRGRHLAAGFTWRDAARRHLAMYAATSSTLAG